MQQGKELALSLFPREGIGPALEAGWATVRAKFQGGIQWVKGLPADFLQMGKNVAMGLVNGIKDGIGAAGDAISGMADTVKNKFKGWLGINSPSRVFAGYGMNVAEGAAIGIRNGQRQALAASASLAASAKAGWGAPRLAPASVSGSAPRGSGWTPPSILTVPDSEARIARAQRTASSVSITFSPTVTIQGNADAKAVHEGLNLTLADLKRMLARLDHDRDRRAYV